MVRTVLSLPLPTGFTSPLSAVQGNVRNSLLVPSLRHTLALVSSPLYLSRDLSSVEKERWVLPPGSEAMEHDAA